MLFPPYNSTTQPNLLITLHAYLINAVWSIRIWPIRIKIFPVLNAYVVMTSSLLHKDTEKFKKNKRFPSTEPFSHYPYRSNCVYPAGKWQTGKWLSAGKKDDAILAGKFKFLGAKMLRTLPMGLAPPAYIWAEVRPSGRHQTAKTKP